MEVAEYKKQGGGMLGYDQIKEVAGMMLRGIGLGMMLTMGLTIAASAEMAGVPSSEEANAQSGTDQEKGPIIRPYELERIAVLPLRYTARKVEFIDESGKVIRVIADTPENIKAIIISKQLNAVLVTEHTKNHGTNQTPWFNVRYYNVRGDEVWSSFICLTAGANLTRQLYISEDGAFVGLTDVDAGDEDYDEKRGLLVAGPECISLRIFTAEGKLAYKFQGGIGFQASPNSKYGVAFNGTEWLHMDLVKGTTRPLPIPEAGGSPGRVLDSGIVQFYTEFGLPPGYERYRYIPGKGIEKVED